MLAGHLQGVVVRKGEQLLPLQLDLPAEDVHRRVTKALNTFQQAWTLISSG